MKPHLYTSCVVPQPIRDSSYTVTAYHEGVAVATATVAVANGDGWRHFAGTPLIRSEAEGG